MNPGTRWGPSDTSTPSLPVARPSVRETLTDTDDDCRRIVGHHAVVGSARRRDQAVWRARSRLIQNPTSDQPDTSPWSSSSMLSPLSKNSAHFILNLAVPLTRCAPMLCVHESLCGISVLLNVVPVGHRSCRDERPSSRVDGDSPSTNMIFTIMPVLPSDLTIPFAGRPHRSRCVGEHTAG